MANNNNFRLNGLNPLAYMGVNPVTPVPFFSRAADPTTTDYANFLLGTIWLNTASEAIWMLVALSNFRGTWVQIGSGASNLQGLTGNSGGFVGPIGTPKNINVVGDGTTIDIVGNPGTHTLTASTTGIIATSYLTDDANSAVPAAGVLTVHGGTGITTSSSGSTVTITATNSGDVTGLETDDGHTVTPTAGTIILAGGTGIATTGTIGPNTATIAVAADVATSYLTDDANSAVPAAHVLTIHGGTGITTSSSGSTITITSTGGSGTVTGLFTTGDSHTVTPTAGVIQLAGSHGLNATGTVGPNTVTVAINNAITLGDITPIAAGSPGLTMTSGDIIFSGDITDPTKNQMIRWSSLGITISNYYNNQFWGQSAGNITLTPAVAIFNIGIGPFSCNALTTGQRNTGVGNGTIEVCTTGVKNTALGYTSLRFVTTGAGNLQLGGSDSSTGITNGSNNILIGYGAGGNYTSSESNNILIGDYGVNGESNKTKISGVRGATTTNNDAVAVLIDSANQLGTVSSSIRYKENVQDMGDASSAIMSLRPVTFNYIEHPEHGTYTGLIAEEVNEIMPSLVAHDKDGEIYSVKYHDLPALLLNELQKQSRVIADLNARIAILESK